MTNKIQSGFLGFFLLGLTLSVGFVISSYILVKGVSAFAQIDQRITVKGYAEQKIVSDLGEWTGSISADGVDLKTAYQRLDASMQKAMNFFDSFGIKKENIEFQGVTTTYQRKYNSKGHQTNEVEKVVLTQLFTYLSNDVKKIKKIAAESSALIQDNIAFQSQNPKYSYTRLNDLKLDLLGKATQNAKSRAEKLVAGSNNKVGNLRSARQGVFQITAPNSTDVSGYGVFDTSTINKVIKAIVTIEYTIE